MEQNLILFLFIQVIVIHFHHYIFCILGNYLNARKGAKGFEENSAYETEKELGKGKRKRIKKIIQSDSDSDFEIRKKSKFPAPPKVPFKSQDIKINKAKKLNLLSETELH